MSPMTLLRLAALRLLAASRTLSQLRFFHSDVIALCFNR